MIIPVTVILAVRNEAANLKRCLDSLTEFERVVVVDSFSTDETGEIADEGGAEVVQFRYVGGYPKKRQWALDTIGIETPWVFLLDADEMVPLELKEEIRAVTTNRRSADGYLIQKGFHFLGRRLKYGGFSHSAVLLFRTGRACFEHVMDDNPGGLDMEVHERLIVDGRIGRLSTALVHEDFKGLDAYIRRHNQYSSWEAANRQKYLAQGVWGKETIQPRFWGNVQERRRFLKQLICRMPAEPWIWFVNHYVFRLGFLEGKRGLIACQLRAQYISNVRAKMFETSLRSAKKNDLHGDSSASSQNFS